MPTDKSLHAGKAALRKKVRFIYNPSSGETRITDYLDGIIDLYQREGYTIVPYRLTFDDAPEAMIEGLNRSYHHVLIAGGDGTVNYVVNTLKANDIDIPVAVLPAGTANDFSSMLGIRQTNILNVCKSLIDGQIKRIDLGLVNGRYFVNVFSCGLFTDVSQKTPTILKNTLGKIAYYLGGIGELANFHKMKLHVDGDGGVFEGDCIIFLVFNGRTAGKIKIAYLSEIDDGLLDVLVFKGDTPRETMQTFMHYLSPTVASRRKRYPAGIEHFRCSRLHAECVGCDATDIDGQEGPAFPIEMTCEKGALRVLVPQPKSSSKGSRKSRG